MNMDGYDNEEQLTEAELEDLRRERAAARRRKLAARERRRKKRRQQAIIRCSILLIAVILVIFIIIHIPTSQFNKLCALKRRVFLLHSALPRQTKDTGSGP